MTQQAKKLKSEVEAKIKKWDERSNFTMKGVKNLSMSDMDTLVLYAENSDGRGNFPGYMEPRGAIREVLEKYNIV